MAIYCVKSNGSIETYSDSNKDKINKSIYVLVTNDSEKATNKANKILNNGKSG